MSGSAKFGGFGVLHFRYAPDGDARVFVERGQETNELYPITLVGFLPQGDGGDSSLEIALGSRHSIEIRNQLLELYPLTDYPIIPSWRLPWEPTPEEPGESRSERKARLMYDVDRFLLNLHPEDSTDTARIIRVTGIPHHMVRSCLLKLREMNRADDYNGYWWKSTPRARLNRDALRV